MYKIAILDGNMESGIETKKCLCKIINGIQENVGVELYVSGRECLKHSFDIILLETVLPDISGLEVKNQLSHTNTALCFVTNHSEMMNQAFGKNVFGYLEKPVKIDQLRSVIGEMFHSNRFLLDESGKKIGISEICYIEASGQYTKIVCREKDAFFSGHSIGEYEDKLRTYEFFRCHRKYLVNLSKITLVQNHRLFLGGVCLPISRRKVCDFKEKYNEYLKEYSNWVKSV